MTYLRLALLAGIALLVAACVALWYRAEAAVKDRDIARAALSIAEEANKAQAKAIDQLHLQAEINDRVMSQFADDISSINKTLAETNADVGALKDANEGVRAYLGARVPAELERLLNR